MPPSLSHSVLRATPGLILSVIISLANGCLTLLSHTFSLFARLGFEFSKFIRFASLVIINSALGHFFPLTYQCTWPRVARKQHECSAA